MLRVSSSGAGSPLIRRRPGRSPISTGEPSSLEMMKRSASSPLARAPPRRVADPAGAAGPLGDEEARRVPAGGGGGAARGVSAAGRAGGGGVGVDGRAAVFVEGARRAEAREHAVQAGAG